MFLVSKKNVRKRTGLASFADMLTIDFLPDLILLNCIEAGFPLYIFPDKVLRYARKNGLSVD